MNAPYTYIWEFEVPPETLDDFLAYYVPGGEWSQLFARSAGYLGTVLLNDRTRPFRYLTVDRWESETAYQRFLHDFREAYDEIDKRCQNLTTTEMSLGSYSVVLPSKRA